MYSLLSIPLVLFVQSQHVICNEIAVELRKAIENEYINEQEALKILLECHTADFPRIEA
jgi:hypothetical protein